MAEVAPAGGGAIRSTRTARLAIVVLPADRAAIDGLAAMPVVLIVGAATAAVAFPQVLSSSARIAPQLGGRLEN